MQPQHFETALARILVENPRYPASAYLFLREVLDFTVHTLKKPARGPNRHVSGHELLDGMRRYALQEYGPMARTVLASIGITRTEDLGEIVFNLVNHGLLGKTDEDRKSDFANGYDFHEAFDVPYLPLAQRPSAAALPPSAQPHATGRKPSETQ